MAKIDNDIAAAAIIRNKAQQFVRGKANVSRAFFRQAIGIKLTSTEEIGQKLNIDEKQVNKALQLSMSNKDLLPIAQMIVTRAEMRCQMR